MFLVIGTLAPPPCQPRPDALPTRTQVLPTARVLTVRLSSQRHVMPILAALLVLLPVFLQAPWVRLQPFSAALFTLPLLLLGLSLERYGRGVWKTSGPLLVGFSGSWLAGCLFWGWCREHPLWHLPIEAFALPLALTGLSGRWRIACSFYLASLLGTACTDAVMALVGVMRLWPAVVQAAPDQAARLLQEAALAVLQPPCLVLVLGVAAALAAGCHWAWRDHLDGAWRIAAAALSTTVAVDGLFLGASLLAPKLSGLI